MRPKLHEMAGWPNTAEDRRKVRHERSRHDGDNDDGCGNARNAECPNLQCHCLRCGVCRASRALTFTIAGETRGPRNDADAAIRRTHGNVSGDTILILQSFYIAQPEQPSNATGEHHGRKD
jgi:hypothetical protein